jgi:hypothetical protein
MSIESLQAGDLALLRVAYGPPRIVKVERTTALYIIVDGQKFSKKTGNEVGPRERYFRKTLYVATAEQIAELKKEEKRRGVISRIIGLCSSRSALSNLSDEKLDEIQRLLFDNPVA